MNLFHRLFVFPPQFCVSPMVREVLICTLHIKCLETVGTWLPLFYHFPSISPSKQVPHIQFMITPHLHFHFWNIPLPTPIVLAFQLIGTIFPMNLLAINRTNTHRKLHLSKFLFYLMKLFCPRQIGKEAGPKHFPHFPKKIHVHPSGLYNYLSIIIHAP